MSESPQRTAWLDGAGAGEKFAAMLQQGHTWAEVMRAVEPVSRTPELFTAWANGFGHGIADAAGCIPGHHLALVMRAGKSRTELVVD